MVKKNAPLIKSEVRVFTDCEDTAPALSGGAFITLAPAYLTYANASIQILSRYAKATIFEGR